MDGSKISVFLSYKVQAGVYGMGGSIYEHDRRTMAPVHGRTLFTGQNWGWFAKFEGGSVIHFSYDGYRRMRDDADLGPAPPESMEREHIQHVLSHSSMMLSLRGKDEPAQSTADKGAIKALGLTGSR